jgi:dsRNA-specific ribonuclease
LEQPNLNPVRFFNEKKGEVIEWKENSDGTYICRAQLPDGNEHVGKGKNKKLAKYDACRKALQELQSNK